MRNPLPAVGLPPPALIWFGPGSARIVFALAHAVLWAVALNTHVGFMGVSNEPRMVGRNYGVRGPVHGARMRVPAALSSILSGLKIGWAFAWRTLIAAELVLGTTSRSRASCSRRWSCTRSGVGACSTDRGARAQAADPPPDASPCATPRNWARTRRRIGLPSAVCGSCDAKSISCGASRGPRRRRA